MIQPRRKTRRENVIGLMKSGQPINYRSYAGIGSRKTPPHVLAAMTQIAEALAERGYILRSGGAGGADSAFEKGAGSAKKSFCRGVHSTTIAADKRPNRRKISSWLVGSE